VTSSLAVFEALIRVTSTRVIKSCLKTREKANLEIKEFFTQISIQNIVYTGWPKK